MLHVTAFDQREKSHTDSAHDWEVGYPRKKYIDHKISTMGEILRTGRRSHIRGSSMMYKITACAEFF